MPSSAGKPRLVAVTHEPPFLQGVRPSRAKISPLGWAEAGGFACRQEAGWETRGHGLGYIPQPRTHHGPVTLRLPCVPGWHWGLQSTADGDTGGISCPQTRVPQLLPLSRSACRPSPTHIPVQLAPPNPAPLSHLSPLQPKTPVPPALLSHLSPPSQLPCPSVTPQPTTPSHQHPQPSTPVPPTPPAHRSHPTLPPPAPALLPADTRWCHRLRHDPPGDREGTAAQ